MNTSLREEPCVIAQAGGVVLAWALAVVFVALALTLGYIFPALRARSGPSDEEPGENKEPSDQTQET
jgi:hypothetical protein